MSLCPEHAKPFGGSWLEAKVHSGNHNAKLVYAILTRQVSWRESKAQANVDRKYGVPAHGSEYLWE